MARRRSAWNSAGLDSWEAGADVARAVRAPRCVTFDSLPLRFPLVQCFPGFDSFGGVDAFENVQREFAAGHRFADLPARMNRHRRVPVRVALCAPVADLSGQLELPVETFDALGRVTRFDVSLAKLASGQALHCLV